jgi:hypothetical protein
MIEATLGPPFLQSSVDLSVGVSVLARELCWNEAERPPVRYALSAAARKYP